MEEQQIQEFIHRVTSDENVRRELMRNPTGVIKRQNFSPRVARIITRLVPQLAFEQAMQSNEKWWHA